MTNTDYEQLAALRQQRIDAVNADLRRLEAVRDALTVYGKFDVLSVQAYGGGYQVRIAPVTWGQDTVVKHVEAAGYSCAGYGTDYTGMYVNVGEK
jgi:hypothetical protein